MVRRIKIKNAASIYEAMPAFQILPPSSERREYYHDPLPLKEENPRRGRGLAFLFASLRNLEPVNLNPEPVAPATRLERKETHLLLFRQSFEDAHGV